MPQRTIGIEGVSDIRDESNRDGVRVVIELKKNATPDVTLNQLWRHTPAQSSFPANMLAIRGGRPETLMLIDFIQAFIQFREEVITRRAKFELFKARERAHLLLGLVVAVTNLDEVVRIIRGSANPAEARAALLAREWPIAEIKSYIQLVEAVETAIEGDTYQLSEAQVRAILELRLHRLTALGRDEIGAELKELALKIAELLDILGDRAKLYAVMRAEFDEVSEQYATPRVSEITAGDFDIEDEDLIAREEMVVTVTHSGYIKRTPLATFRAQRRGGKGRAGMATKDEDVVTRLFVTSTHTPVLFFSNKGQVYRMKVWKLPEGSPQTKGRPMQNLLPLSEDEYIRTVLPLPEDEAEWEKLHVMFATAKGSVRRNSMDAFENIPSNGKIAMRFAEDSDDKLIGVALLQESDDVLLATRNGKAIRFSATDVRAFASRTATGVRGVTLKDDDEVISLSVMGATGTDIEERDAYLKAAPWKDNDNEPELAPETMSKMIAAEQFILTVCSNGYGKRSSAYEYRLTKRGGQGVVNIDNIKRNGRVVASFPASNDSQAMLITDQGKLIRMNVSDVRVMGRSTAGVTLLDVAKGEKVVGVALIDEEEGPEDAAEEAVAAEIAGDEPQGEAE